jgi:hypothetical protein
MSVAKILSKFQPNKKIFFTLFDEMAVNLKEVNLLLKQVLSSNDSVHRMTLLPVLNSLKEKNEVNYKQIVGNLYAVNNSKNDFIMLLTVAGCLK